MVLVRSVRTNGRDVEDVDGSLASPAQERPPQEEVEGQSLMTAPDNQPVGMKKWITPLAFGRDSRSFSVRKDMG